MRNKKDNRDAAKQKHHIRTNGQTNGQTNGPTDGPMDGRAKPLIELRVCRESNNALFTRGFCPEKGARYDETFERQQHLKNESNYFVTSNKVDQTQRPLNTLKTNHSAQKCD